MGVSTLFYVHFNLDGFSESEINYSKCVLAIITFGNIRRFPLQPRFETQTVAQAQKEFSVDRISNLTPSCRMDRVRDPDDWGLSGLRHFVVTIRN